MKLVGTILIIISSTGLGFVVARQFILRSKQLKQIKLALELLQTEISYGITPLPQAFEKIASELDAPVDNFFVEAREGLKAGQTAKDAWQQAVKKVISQTALGQTEEDVLLDFGCNLGQSTSDDQLRYLNLAQDHINNLHQEAITDQKEKVKLWRYLGVLGGLFIVILIF
ncbi:stage III sporulation protein AB [Halobacteroides halobius DSM 5150]|uniref:Stage III sporulation protein AB n=1 Tax=Halobacteroides halobius (strain ATCC 35273 / DSM 5150 / MD-1) TaxID=748449 RepID=L0K8Q9_HALHC|nr:stage III sporulation protein SpoIIIAB [Halobacteroides halobius]AGB40508.1 stage III sporulation protein AB [Halobacteroides halobius DSM 5150]